MIDTDDYYLILQRARLLDFSSGAALAEHRTHHDRCAVLDVSKGAE
jgi:hypothetical protein